MPHIGICYKISLRHIWLGHGTVTVPAGAFRRPTGATPRLLDRRQTVPYRILYSGESLFKAIPHNSKCRYGERGAADAKPRAQIILDAAKVSAASGGNSEPKQGQRSQSARGFCPRSTMRVPQPDIIEHFGNADVVPQLPERCLSRKAGIVRCCPRNEILLRNIWQGFGTVKTVPYG